MVQTLPEFCVTQAYPSGAGAKRCRIQSTRVTFVAWRVLLLHQDRVLRASRRLCFLNECGDICTRGQCTYNRNAMHEAPTPQRKVGFEPRPLHCNSWKIVWPVDQHGGDVSVEITKYLEAMMHCSNRALLHVVARAGIKMCTGCKQAWFFFIVHASRRTSWPTGRRTRPTARRNKAARSARAKSRAISVCLRNLQRKICCFI